MPSRYRKYPPGYVALTAITLLCTLGYFATAYMSPELVISMESVLGLSSRISLPHVLWQPLTYAFVHSSPMHLFFNLAVIYVFGRSLIISGGGRYILPVFAAGSISGAVFYIVFYGLLLGRGAFLVGASAGALALAVASAVASPRAAIDILGFVRVPAVPLVILVAVLGAVGLIGENFGGALAHIGGLAAGIGAGAVMRRRRARAERHRDALRKELDALRRRINISGYESLDASERNRFMYLTSVLKNEQAR